MSRAGSGSDRAGDAFSRTRSARRLRGEGPGTCRIDRAARRDRSRIGPARGLWSTRTAFGPDAESLVAPRGRSHRGSRRGVERSLRQGCDRSSVRVRSRMFVVARSSWNRRGDAWASWTTLSASRQEVERPCPRMQKRPRRDRCDGGRSYLSRPRHGRPRAAGDPRVRSSGVVGDKRQGVVR